MKSQLDNQDKKRINEIVEQLITLNYSDLFQCMGNEVVDSIWTEPGAVSALQSIVLDENITRKASFFAAEILFESRPDYPEPGSEKVLSEIYANALVGNFTGAANPWGLPGMLDGKAGIDFVALGEAAIPALVRLLDNSTLLLYEGSQEATYGNSCQFRVKDIATFLITQIRCLPYEVHYSSEQRDIDIEELKARLASE